jgi:hypothetical protein
MTDARVEKVYEDRVGAGEFLAQAELLLADADTATLSAASKAILLHNATVCACDAILQAVGLRVTPGDRSHILRLETALDQADDDTEELARTPRCLPRAAQRSVLRGRVRGPRQRDRRARGNRGDHRAGTYLCRRPSA